MKVQFNPSEKFVQSSDIFDRLQSNFCVYRIVIISKYDPTIRGGFRNSSFEFGHS